MDGIFGLTFSFIILRYTTNKNVISPCAEKVILGTEFVNLGKNPPFYELNKWVQKWPLAWRNSKKNCGACK